MADLTRRDVEISKYFKMFVNAQLDRSDLGIFAAAKDGKVFTGANYFQEVFDFCLIQYAKSVTKDISQDLKMLRDRMYRVLLRNKRNIILFLWCYYQMIKIKYKLLAMFGDNNVIGKSFLASKQTAGEGIVILAGDKIVKLVDRAGFSKINREMHRK